MIFSFCSFFYNVPFFQLLWQARSCRPTQTRRQSGEQRDREMIFLFLLDPAFFGFSDRQSWERQRYRRNKRDDISARLRSRSFFHLLWETRPEKQTEMISLFLFDPASFSFFERQGHTDRQSSERQRYERERWRVLVAWKVRKKTSVMPKRFCGVFSQRCREHEKPQRLVKCLLRWCLAGRKISGCAFATCLWSPVVRRKGFYS